MLYCPQDTLSLKLSMFRRKLPYSQVNSETRGFPKYDNTPDQIDRFSSNCLRSVPVVVTEYSYFKNKTFSTLLSWRTCKVVK